MAIHSSAAGVLLPTSELVQGRYRVDGTLGRGGMGEVLAATDLSTGRRLALKRLLPEASSARQVLLFEREFHTLVGLSHPHVIKAYDYGTNDGVPFYTMELLEGRDVETLAPLPWQSVVTTLRSVASALSLLHARRLVHRDVTARNVWMTGEGVVKLIDFGTLSPFGKAVNVTGTPPYVAPEVLRTRMVDQRTDLYSLGALGYFLLTGRHAYPARALADLEQHWSDEYESPSQLMHDWSLGGMPDAPFALEELLDALLAAEPGGRPSSAAEVLDRLAALLPNDQSEQPLVKQGVLASKAFVARQEELRRVGIMLQQAADGTGGSVVLLGPQGVGRTRLLTELGVEARVAGATVLVVNNEEAQSALSAAARCASALLEALPESARNSASSHAAVLGHLSARLRAQLGLDEGQLQPIPAAAGEARMRLHSALSAWLLEVAREHTIVLLLDDLQDMDEPSAALFAGLSRQLGAARLLLIGAVRLDPAAPPGAAVQAFLAKAEPLRLPAFDAQECQQLLGSMFGDVDHLARSATRIVDAAEGNPGRIVDLAEYLVRSDAFRCVEGAWILPQDISAMKLPDTWAALDEARLGQLSDGARALARALSVSEGALSLELCTRLSRLADGEPYAQLDELVSAAILVGAEDGYRFRREEVRRRLHQTLSMEESRSCHAAVAAYLLSKESDSVSHKLMAGLHLLRSGQLQHGAQLVNRTALEYARHNSEDNVELAKLFEQALPLVRETCDSDHELLPVLSCLAAFGYMVDPRFGFSYGPEALERGRRALGMDRARKLRRWLGRRLGLYVALIVAAIMFRRRARKSEAVPSFADAMFMLCTASGTLSGMYAVCLDRKGALDAAESIEPLSALGPDNAASIVYRFGRGCVANVSDDLGSASAHWPSLLARLQDPRPIRGLSDLSRAYYYAASLYAYGSAEAWRDSSRAPEIADLLERQPLQLYRVSADQLRATYYACQGDSRLSAQHRARVELYALQRGMTWQSEIWNPSSAASIGVRTHDAMLVKQAAEQLSQLAKRLPSLQSQERVARAAYLLLRGRADEALPIAMRTNEQRDPMLVGASNCRALLAGAYNDLGRFQDAYDVSARSLAELSDPALMYPAITLRCQTELARAEAGLGRHGEACERIDALIALHAAARGPVTLGNLHEVRARLAKKAGDEVAATEHYAKMDEWYRSTGNPALIQFCDRVARALDPHRKRSDVLSDEGPLVTITNGLTMTTARQEAGSALLVRVVRSAMATEGLLFARTSDNTMELVATSKPELLSGELEAWAQQRWQAALSDAGDTESADDVPVNLNAVELGGTRFDFALLVDDDGRSEPLVGALIVSDAMAPLSLSALHALAARLRGRAQSQSA